jgi:hypothetical protein
MSRTANGGCASWYPAVSVERSRGEFLERYLAGDGKKYWAPGA